MFAKFTSILKRNSNNLITPQLTENIYCNDFPNDLPEKIKTHNGLIAFARRVSSSIQENKIPQDPKTIKNLNQQQEDGGIKESLRLV